MNQSLKTLLIAAVLAGGSACTLKITSPDVAKGKVGEPFHYQITADPQPDSFSASVPPPAGLQANAESGLISGTPLQGGHFDLELGARKGSRSGSATLALQIEPAGSAPAPVPEPHGVVWGKELFITNPVVLNHRRAMRGGAWHIRTAMQKIAGNGNVDQLARDWFNTWARNTKVGGSDEEFKTRPTVARELQSAWDQDRFRLIAIVNRIDLTRFPGNDHAAEPTQLGEGRFIYEMVDASGRREPLTLIFEYNLPGEVSRAGLEKWAQRWHALGRPSLGGANEFGENYLDELARLTDDFSAPGNLNQIRSNEISEGPWEMREFTDKAVTGKLTQRPVAVTPAITLQNSAELAQFVNQNETALLEGLPIKYPPSLQAAVSPVNGEDFRWINDAAASQTAALKLSFISCSGCHAGNTGTPFQHIGLRAPNLSRMMTNEITLTPSNPPPAIKHDERGARIGLLAAWAGDTTVVKALDVAEIKAIIFERANRVH